MIEQTAQSPVARAELFHRIWPLMVVVLGLGLTAGWVCFLAYACVLLVEQAI